MWNHCSTNVLPRERWPGPGASHAARAQALARNGFWPGIGPMWHVFDKTWPELEHQTRDFGNLWGVSRCRFYWRPIGGPPLLEYLYDTAPHSPTELNGFDVSVGCAFLRDSDRRFAPFHVVVLFPLVPPPRYGLTPASTWPRQPRHTCATPCAQRARRQRRGCCGARAQRPSCGDQVAGALVALQGRLWSDP